MPARLGPRFAIEALFLIALAVGAGLADLATRWIVVIMAAGWVIVSLLEVTAERLWATVPAWRRPGYPAATPAPPPAVEPEPAPESEAGLEPEPAIAPEREPVIEPEPETAIVSALPAEEPQPEPG